jgi:hypothetical protein
MKFRMSFVAHTVLTASFLLTGVTAQAQCDGLPHPETGHPAPCFPGGPHVDHTELADQLREMQRQNAQDEQQREAQRQVEQHQRCLQIVEAQRLNCSGGGYCPVTTCF